MRGLALVVLDICLEGADIPIEGVLLTGEGAEGGYQQIQAKKLQHFCTFVCAGARMGTYLYMKLWGHLGPECGCHT